MPKKLNFCGLIYSITCIQRPLKGSNESGLLQQVVFKHRFYKVDLRRVVYFYSVYRNQIYIFCAKGLTVEIIKDEHSDVAYPFREKLPSQLDNQFILPARVIPKHEYGGIYLFIY